MVLFQTQSLLCLYGYILQEIKQLISQQVCAKKLQPDQKMSEVGQ